MSYYFIANIRINDPVEYQKYIEQAGEIFSKFKGEYIVVDNQPQLLEGSWEYTRVVMIRFNTEEDFSAWYYSEEYQGILKHRLTASNCDSILAKGLPQK